MGTKHHDTSSYFFLIDPLCAWCYAAMPSIAALRQQVGDNNFCLSPTGLFAGNGARPMTRQFRDHAWQNDQRIKAMTGQAFTQAYYDRVLSDFDVAFDSGPASLILSLADLLQPGCAFNLLTALQHGRFVDGRDLTDQDVLVDIAAASGSDSTLLLAALQDADRMEEAVDRITAARRQLARHGIEAVPTLIQLHAQENRVIPNNFLVGGGSDLVAHCTTLSRS